MLAVEELTRHYEALCAQVPLRPIRTRTDYRHAVRALNELMDAGAAAGEHPLADLLATLGELIGDYEDAARVPRDADPVDVLRFLMQQHGLTQSGLPEIGSQGVVSELLSGRRALNVRQINALARRFGVSPAVFLPDA
jgi:HTH-type transcriptional regulator / antitoxin HigA